MADQTEERQAPIRPANEEATIKGVSEVFDEMEKDKKNPLYELFRGGIDEELGNVGAKVWGIKSNFGYDKFYKKSVIPKEISEGHMAVLTTLASIDNYDKMRDDWFFGGKESQTSDIEDLSFSLAFLLRCLRLRRKGDTQISGLFEGHFWCWDLSKRIIDLIQEGPSLSGYKELGGGNYQIHRILLKLLRAHQKGYGASRGDPLLKDRDVDDELYKMASFCFLRILNELRLKPAFKAVMEHYDILARITAEFLGKYEKRLIQKIPGLVIEYDVVKLKAYGEKMRASYVENNLEAEAKKTCVYLNSVLAVLSSQYENTKVLKETIVDTYFGSIDWDEAGGKNVSAATAKKTVTALTQMLIRDSINAFLELVGTMKIVTMLADKVIAHLENVDTSDTLPTLVPLR